MENFYKKIKEKLSNPPKTSTDWQVWEKISGEIESKPGGIPLWWWAPGLVLLGGVAGYFLHFHEDAVIPIENTVYVTDTLYINNETVVNDTVYINRYLPPNNLDGEELKNIPQYVAIQKESGFLQKEITELREELDAIGRTMAESTLRRDEKFIPFIDAYLKRNPTAGIQLQEERALLENPGFVDSGIYFAAWNKRRPIVRNVFWDKLITSQKGESFLESLVPDYFNIGAVLDGPGFAFHNEVDPGIDIGGGIQVEMLFSSKISLQSGISGRVSMGSTENVDLASTFPQPQNVAENVRFDKLKILSKFLDLPLSLKYKIRQNQKWDVFIKGGMILSKPSEIEYKYEYKDVDTEIYYEVKSEHGNWNLGSFALGLGVETNVFSRWTLSIEPQLRYNFDSNIPNNYKNHAIGIRFGMMYNL